MAVLSLTSRVQPGASPDIIRAFVQVVVQPLKTGDGKGSGNVSTMMALEWPLATPAVTPAIAGADAG
jgi:hypothetical protein